MKMKELLTEDKPRERLINEGITALSNIELLALIIGSGGKKENVFDIANNILKKYKLSDLRKLNYYDLINISGIKKAKACLLLASFELAKRSLIINDDNIYLENSKQIYEYVKNYFYLATTEKLVIAFLSCKLKVLGVKVFENYSSTSVDIPFRLIIKLALDYQCYGLIIAHNHPTNDCNPSKADIKATYTFKHLVENLGFILLDHIIVTDNEYYSFNDTGLIDEDLEYNILGDLFEIDR